MIWQQTSFYSEILKKNQEFYSFIPQLPVPKNGWPLLLLLHGLGGSHQSWQRNTQLEKFAELYNVAIICPNADRSFYANTFYGNYWTFFKEELWQIIHNLYPLTTKREERAVCGLSMGGYGALKHGFNLPERFGYVASLSGMANMDAVGPLAEDGSYHFLAGEKARLLADVAENHAEDNLLEAIETAITQYPDNYPKLYLSCGEQDVFLKEHRELSAYLTQKGYSHQAVTAEGGHEWFFWNREIGNLFELFFPFKKYEPQALLQGGIDE